MKISKKIQCSTEKLFLNNDVICKIKPIKMMFCASMCKTLFYIFELISKIFIEFSFNFYSKYFFSIYTNLKKNYNIR